MGQDREFTEEQKQYALKCIKHFKEQWEKIENRNLERDVLAKTAGLDFDGNYRTYWETQDLAELEKKIQDAILSATNDKNAEGDEITEAEKEVIRKEERYRLTTLGFYGPAALAEWKALQDKTNSVVASGVGGAPVSSEAHDRNQSQMSSSIRESAQISKSKEQTEEQQDLGPPYTP